jgi:hypothetical protein
MARLSTQTQELLDRVDKAIAVSELILSERARLRSASQRMAAVIDWEAGNLGPSSTTAKWRDE